MKIFTKKRVLWGVIVLVVLLVIYGIAKPKDNSKNITTDTVKKQDIKRTVLATGQVVSQTDLQLSFKTSGVVNKVNVKEGQKVKTGDILAQLDQRDQAAALTSARGSIAAAQANYQRVISGASSEDVAVAQVALDNAKSTLDTTTKQQQVLVDNAYKALLNSPIFAVPGTGNTGSETLALSGAYTGTEQGMYKISVYTTGSGVYYQVSGLESANDSVSTTPKPLGTKGLYIAFSNTSVPTTDTWTISIPNTQSSTYVANYNAYQAALETQKSAVQAAQNAVAAAQAALDLKKAQARPADVKAAEAQILSAQGQYQSALAAFENTQIKAPADGVITKVDIKLGELASALKEVIVLQDVGNLHLEANVSEANIADVREGQEVDVTFDALGPDRHFISKVQTVNPASTVVSGVVNYKVTSSLEKLDEIKPGMTANMTILSAEKKDVLAVPLRAVVSNGEKHIRVVTDPKKKTYREISVTTGLEADGGLVEITSGLNEGEEIVTFIKK